MTRGAVVDGRRARQGAFFRLRRRGQRLMVSRAERDEAVLDRRLLAQPGVTRPNSVAVMSATGGVGKTTCTFVIGNVLASHVKLRTIAVDAGTGFGTLGQLAPRDRRVDRGATDLLEAADRIHTASELTPYVTRVSTGLHVLAAARGPAPERYGELVALLSCFYDVVLLDLSTGVVGPLPRLVVGRADQIVLVTRPTHVAATAALDALAHIRRQDRTTVAVNATERAVEEAFLPHHAVALPEDEQLASMLETGTYTLGALDGRTRIAIKHLVLAVAERLV
jgi:MinD-like ATPase involved in chromosome partitioning or flagellar assembly